AGGSAAGGGGADVVVESERLPMPDASVLSPSTPPDSCTASQAPTAITTARINPTQAGQWRNSLSTKNLTTVKSRIRKPSSAPVIASETGSLTSTAASRTRSQASRTTVRSPMITPTPCQPLTPPSPSVVPPNLTSTCCQSRKLSI